MNKIELTLEEFMEKIDDIMEAYDNGDSTHYKVSYDKGECMCIPYDGPYTETVKQDEEGNLFVTIPKRICSKLNIKEGDELNMEITVEGYIKLTKIQVAT